jgi:hypothetical protein
LALREGKRDKLTRLLQINDADAKNAIRKLSLMAKQGRDAVKKPALSKAMTMGKALSRARVSLDPKIN